MDPHIYLVGLAALSLVNAGLAQANGRSTLGWFLATLLVGPIATFLIVLLAMLAPEQQQLRPAAPVPLVGPPRQRTSPEG